MGRASWCEPRINEIAANFNDILRKAGQDGMNRLIQGQILKETFHEFKNISHAYEFESRETTIAKAQKTFASEKALQEIVLKTINFLC